MQGVSKVEALRITGTVFQNAIALRSRGRLFALPGGIGDNDAQGRIGIASGVMVTHTADVP